MDGFPDFSYSDVTLREVTIDGDGRSTLVRDGTCLHLASGSFRRTPVWTCDPSFLTDGTCDCGCATPDPEFPDSAASSCDWCWCGNGRCPTTENPTRNYTCLSRRPLAKAKLLPALALGARAQSGVRSVEGFDEDAGRGCRPVIDSVIPWSGNVRTRSSAWCGGGGGNRRLRRFVREA
jgi:hypothetical protein